MKKSNQFQKIHSILYERKKWLIGLPYKLNKQSKKIYLQNTKKFKEYVSFSKLGNYGRFGNQLFQYAAVKSYSLKHSIPLLLPPGDEHRLYELRIERNSASIQDIEFAADINYVQKEFEFTPTFFDYYPRINFEGFFQSEKYFSDYEDIIRTEFQLRDQKKLLFVQTKINEIRQDNPGKKLVAVHVRRGDTVPSKVNYGDKHIGAYRNNKELKHPLLKESYFRQAMDYYPDSLFIFFSDTNEDIKWCKETFNNSNNIFLHYNDLIDFTLMQFCDHNIISNSTFSWWAAWLNTNKNKRVIAPKIWFGVFYNEYNLVDLMPEKWIQI